MTNARRTCAVALSLACCAVVAACGEGDGSGPASAEVVIRDNLSEYRFFTGPPAAQNPARGVVPYTPVSPLWADHAGKGRFIVLPRGAVIDPIGDEDWDFPIGTVIVKSFFLADDRRDPDGPARIVETRLLVREDSEEVWSAHTYVWNAEQTDATRMIAGTRLTFDVVDMSGDVTEQVYVVPNTNQCRDCHARDDVTVLLGINSVQLDYETVIEGEPVNQLQWLVDRGLFAVPPTRTEAALVAPTDASEPLAARARSYLHANCSHCHRPGGDGGRTGLDLRAWQDEPGRYGVCKPPVAAGAGAGGRSYDIVPGAPDESILPFRMASTDPEIRMPELPSRLADDFGVNLIREWIAAMAGDGCN